MPRGKKTPPQVVENVLASLAETGNTRQTARDTGVPQRTVDDIQRQNGDEFAQLRSKKRDEMIDKANEVAFKLLNLLGRKAEMISDDESGEALAATDMREISTPFGVVIDKARLMEGQTTENIGVDLLRFEDF